MTELQKEYCEEKGLIYIKPEIKNNYPPAGTTHNALSDCYYQVGYCSEIWRSLNYH